jgi:hypothetical protein
LTLVTDTSHFIRCCLFQLARKPAAVLAFIEEDKGSRSWLRLHDRDRDVKILLRSDRLLIVTRILKRSSSVKLLSERSWTVQTGWRQSTVNRDKHTYSSSELQHLSRCSRAHSLLCLLISSSSSRSSSGIEAETPAGWDRMEVCQWQDREQEDTVQAAWISREE